MLMCVIIVMFIGICTGNIVDSPCINRNAFRLNLGVNIEIRLVVKWRNENSRFGDWKVVNLKHPRCKFTRKSGTGWRSPIRISHSNRALKKRRLIELQPELKAKRGHAHGLGSHAARWQVCGSRKGYLRVGGQPNKIANPGLLTDSKRFSIIGFFSLLFLPTSPFTLQLTIVVPKIKNKSVWVIFDREF